MRFAKGTKEWNMFGELYSLFKKWSIKDKINYKELWASCAEFGHKYREEKDGFQSLSYQLACDLHLFIMTEKGNRTFTFDNDSEEKQMFTEFYRLCQKYWEPMSDDNDEYWTECIREFTEFEEKFSEKEETEFNLPKNWAITITEYFDKKIKQ